jgi:predicted O-methyltransferase YrrM
MHELNTQLKISGTRDEITHAMLLQASHAFMILENAHRIVARCKDQMEDYQAIVLSVLSSAFNAPGARILEIGTAYGFSAAIMALSAPLANVATINPSYHEVQSARYHYWKHDIKNVEVIRCKSSEYLADNHLAFDFIFIDGDHKNVSDDMIAFDALTVGGVILFHDYSPTGAYRACPPVYRAVKQRQEEFRDFDILVIDENNTGMAGWIKRIGETWQQN